MTDLLSPSDIWADISAVRERSPLVHSITNFVVMNLNANVLLAAGASPVMAHAHEEVQAMAGIAQALVLNIGTLEPAWMESMRLALLTASQRGIPTVLDPVGAGATVYRNASIELLLNTAAPTVIRGNSAEIMSVASGAANDTVGSARALVGRTGGVVCVSGQTDHVVDATRWALLSNGHPWMTKIAGVGCSATALIGAFCAVQPDDWRATVSAMALMGVVGEVAAEKAVVRKQGVGSMQVLMLDELQLLDQATLEARLKMEFKPL